MEKAKVIKIWPAPHIEIRVHVSEEMIKDFKKCYKLSEMIEKRKSILAIFQSCEGCSWRNICIEEKGTEICTLLDKKSAAEQLGFSEKDMDILSEDEFKKLPKEEKIIHYLLYRATGDEIDEFVHSVDKDRLPFVFRFDESNLRDVIKQIPENVFEALYKKINLDT